MEEIVIYGHGDFDLIAEVDLFGAQLSEQLRASRRLQLLICDKTVVNVLAYARLVLDAAPGTPSDKLEDGEHALDAVIREGKEEIGITLQPDDLHLTGVVHCRNPEGEGRIGLFFATPYRPDHHGEPHNAEPHKCADLAWYPVHQPPPNTVPYTTAGLTLHQTGQPFTAYGWTPAPLPWVPSAGDRP